MKLATVPLSLEEAHMLTVLDLFSGIGGFSLGLERTGGFQTVAFCEMEPYCQAVLSKHWPDVPIFSDIKTLGGHHVGPVDVICGGFPCQDISSAGKQEGLAGERSGLWFEFARLIGEIRPRFVVVENVSALLAVGMGGVLGELAKIGYDAEWHSIPAAALGAPHRRDRVWILAYPNTARGPQQIPEPQCGNPPFPSDDGAPQSVADAAGKRRGKARPDRERPQERLAGRSEVLANATSNGREEPAQPWPHDPETAGRRQVNGGRGSEALANADSEGLSNGGQAGVPSSQSQAIWGMALAESQRRCEPWWAVEPNVGRVAHGVPARVDRLRALGNAVVPQIPEMIGHVILERKTRPLT